MANDRKPVMWNIIVMCEEEIINEENIIIEEEMIQWPMNIVMWCV